MTHIYTNKKTQNETKKIHAHYDRIREKQNKIDKVKSNLFFYFSSVKDMKIVSKIFPVS